MNEYTATADRADVEFCAALNGSGPLPHLVAERMEQFCLDLVLGEGRQRTYFFVGRATGFRFGRLVCDGQPAYGSSDLWDAREIIQSFAGPVDLAEVIELDSY